MNKVYFLSVFAISIGLILIYSIKIYLPLSSNYLSLKIDDHPCSIKYKILDNELYYIDSQLHNSSVTQHPNAVLSLITSPKISSLLPNFLSILWTAETWQETNTDAPKFLLYSAHSSFRSKSHELKIYVLALYNGKHQPEKYYAYIWFNVTGPPLGCPYLKHEIVDYQGFATDRLVPYLLTCSVPHIDIKGQRPIGISILNSPCSKATNILQISGNKISSQATSSGKSAKHNNTLRVGICSPALYFYNEDFSVRMIEWIELLKKIGASKFYIYKCDVHRNLEKVLQYYVEKGDVVIIDFNYPPPYMDYKAFRRLWTLVKRKQIFAMENIYFSDCILRFKNEVDYLAHFDPDEMPILLKHDTLQDFLRSIEKANPLDIPASIQLKWWPFYNDLISDAKTSNISNSFHILRHSKRPAAIFDDVDNNVKSIYNPKRVIGAYSHLPFLFTDDSKKKFEAVPLSTAYLAHFRIQDCKERCPPQTIKNEFRLLKYSKDVVSQVTLIAKELKLELR